jgi:hypothetical protein
MDGEVRPMKARILWSAVLVAMSMAASAQTKVSDLGWMAGNWKASIEGNTAERSCTAATAGSMMCMMRVIAGGQVVWMEFSILRDTSAGMLLDTRFFEGNGNPSAPISTELRLRSATADQAIFDNPSGTQPKSESVTRNAPDTITSHADLVDSKGTADVIDVVWTRVH